MLAATDRRGRVCTRVMVAVEDLMPSLYNAPRPRVTRIAAPGVSRYLISLRP
jgi:hypothetical protein